MLSFAWVAVDKYDFHVSRYVRAQLRGNTGNTMLLLCYYCRAKEEEEKKTDKYLIIRATIKSKCTVTWTYDSKFNNSFVLSNFCIQPLRNTKYTAKVKNLIITIIIIINFICIFCFFILTIPTPILQVLSHLFLTPLVTWLYSSKPYLSLLCSLITTSPLVRCHLPLSSALLWNHIRMRLYVRTSCCWFLWSIAERSMLASP